MYDAALLEFVNTDLLSSVRGISRVCTWILLRLLLALSLNPLYCFTHVCSASVPVD